MKRGGAASSAVVLLFFALMLVDASLLVRLLLTPGLQRGGAIFRFINEPTKEGAYVDEEWTVPLRDYVDRGGCWVAGRVGRHVPHPSI